MTTRPPESLKDRLATIVQRGHVEKRTADEVAEMCLLECYGDSCNNPQDWFPHKLLRALIDRECAAKDARIAELEKALAPFATYASGRCPFNLYGVGTSLLWEHWKAAISAATKEGEVTPWTTPNNFTLNP